MLLGAYYYLWYGSPTVPIVGGGDWERSGFTQTPLLGKYDSRDPSVISRHIDWAKAAGLDFLAMSWKNIASWDDITLKEHYLRHPKSSEIKFCIFYDSIPALNRHRFGQYVSYDLAEKFSPEKTKGVKLLEDFDYLAKTYFSLPQYLKIDGKPVVILYNASAFRNVENYFEKLPSLFFVADAVCWAGVKLAKSSFSFLWENSPKESIKVIYRAFRRLSPKSYESDFSLSKYFQAITAYNLYSPNRTGNFFKNLEALYEKFSRYARSNNLYFIPNIMPGYDERGLMSEKNQPLKRNDGEFYKRFSEISRKYLDHNITMALVTSFNEWHEDTQIEPSREYGSKYLELTKLLKG